MQHKPILNYDFSLDEAAATGGWKDAGKYGVWVELQPRGTTGTPYQVHEIREGGLYRLPMKSRIMHVIPGGMMYRIAHLFAPWRVSDADMIYLRAELEHGTYHSMMSAQSRTVRQDHVVWLCPNCGQEMVRASFDTAREGLLNFWPFLLGQVRIFNATPDKQLCPSCGHKHPVCYGFDRKSDTPAEAGARTEW